MKKFIFKILFGFAAFGSIAFFAHAQNATQTPETPDLFQQEEDKLKILEEILPALTKTFEVEFSPKYPGANTKVLAQLISYTFDVNRSEIAWIVNGKTAGTGKIFSFTTGDIGSELFLRVSVMAEGEVPLGKSFTFGAGEVSLLWETAGYAPAQYRGKILPVSRSPIKIVAVPRGFASSDSSLIYEWKRNYKNIPDSSGKGKKTFTFYGDEAGSETIEVVVSNFDKSAVVSKRTEIKIAEPKILFYEEHPLEGPQYQKALSDKADLEKQELILRAEPFFFSKKTLSALSYQWIMNNKKIELPLKPNVLSLVVPSDQKGKSIIKLTMENLKNIFERAEKSLRINFDLQ